MNSCSLDKTLDRLEISQNRVKEILEENNLLVECKIDTRKINYISNNSKDIEDRTLFFCKGVLFKKEYLAEAVKNGCISYISEVKYDIEDVSYFIVNNILKAIAVIASEFFREPSRNLTKIGVTGTKGKTTVTYFLNNILKEYKKEKIGLLSSIQTFLGDKFEKSHLTTPEALELQRDFYEMTSNNIKYVTMEVSSQSYKRMRLEGVEFEYGMFLNIGNDHISASEHPDFEDYLNCKLEFLKHVQNIIINADSDCIEKINEAVKGKKVIYYSKDKKYDYYLGKINKTDTGYVFEVKNDKLNYQNVFEIKMCGNFNVENALAAITVCKTIGVDDESIKKGLINTQVEGRMTVLKNSEKTVVIDYAHNELSYNRII